MTNDPSDSDSKKENETTLQLVNMDNPSQEEINFGSEWSIMVNDSSSILIASDDGDDSGPAGGPAAGCKAACAAPDSADAGG